MVDLQVLVHFPASCVMCYKMRARWDTHDTHGYCGRAKWWDNENKGVGTCLEYQQGETRRGETIWSILLTVSVIDLSMVMAWLINIVVVDEVYHCKLWWGLLLSSDKAHVWYTWQLLEWDKEWVSNADRWMGTKVMQPRRSLFSLLHRFWSCVTILSLSLFTFYF